MLWVPAGDTLILPANEKTRVIGLFYAQANNLVSPFTKEDAKFVSAVANEIALNIDNIRFRKEVLRNEHMAAVGLRAREARDYDWQWFRSLSKNSVAD